MTSKQDAAIRKTVEHLLTHGPDRTLPATRRIRLFLDSVCLADTTSAVYVWEKPYYPWYYVPRRDLLQTLPPNVVLEQGDLISLPAGHNPADDHGSSQPSTSARFWKISVEHDNASTGGDGKGTGWRIVEFHGGALDGLVRVDYSAIDQWYEEDVPVHVHPKDPFKRVDVLPSSRHVRISSLDGHLLADTHFSMHLHETSLPVRYYLPLTAVNRPSVRLTPSSTSTKCPYKGTAAYYNVVLPGGAVLKDLVWYYDAPNIECAGIAGLACFYNEKVEIEIDGVRHVKPKTHFV